MGNALMLPATGDVPGWEQLVAPGAQRTDQAKELDALGGKRRPALRRGASAAMHAQWFKDALRAQQCEGGTMAQQELVAGLCALQRLHQKDESPPRGRQTLRPQVHFATSRSKSQPASMQPTPEASQLTLPPIGKADVSPFQKAKAASNLQPKPQAASASNSPEKKNEWKSYLHSEALRNRLRRQQKVGIYGGAFSPSASGRSSVVLSTATSASRTSDGSDSSGRTDDTAKVKKTSPVRVEPPPEWRQRIEKAKQMARRIIGVYVLLMKGSKYAARMAGRLPEQSQRMEDILGEQLPKFCQHAAVHAGAAHRLAGLRAELAAAERRLSEFNARVALARERAEGASLAENPSLASLIPLRMAAAGPGRHPPGLSTEVSSMSVSGSAFGAPLPALAPAVLSRLQSIGTGRRVTVTGSEESETSAQLRRELLQARARRSSYDACPVPLVAQGNATPGGLPAAVPRASRFSNADSWGSGVTDSAYGHMGGSRRASDFSSGSPLPGSRRCSVADDPAALAAEADVWAAECAALAARIAGEEAALFQAGRMMAMYVNRGNGRYFEEHQWRNPEVFNITQLAGFAGNNRAAVLRDEVIAGLKVGRIAFQFMCLDEGIALPDGARSDPLFTTDPWQLAQQCGAGAGPSQQGSNRLHGLSLGMRALLQLAQQVGALAGTAAVSHLVVLLHYPEHCEQEIIQQLADHRLCGLCAENLILVPQYRRQAHAADPSAPGCLGPMHGSRYRACGSGYGMLQLAWHDAACRFAPGKRLGALQNLGSSVLAFLRHKEVMWMVNSRLRDMRLYTADSAVDVDGLMHAIFAHEHSGTPMTMQVLQVETQQAAKAHQNVVLVAKEPQIAPKRAAAHAAAASAAVMAAATAPAAPIVPLSIGGVTQLKISELHTPKAIEALEALHAEGCKTTVSLNRFIYHVPALKDMLVPEAFRPELVITGGQLHLRLDACDLATAPGAGAAVVTARTVPRLLLTHHDAEALCAKVSLQDRRPSFRRLLGLCLPDAKKRGSMTGDETSDQANDMTRGQRVLRTVDEGGRHFLVFIADNIASRQAVELLCGVVRPGADCVHLATAVLDKAFTAMGEELLAKYEEPLLRSLVATKCHVVVRQQGQPLVDCLASFAAAAPRCDLLVFGSMALTVAPTDPWPMCSVSLALLKATLRPALVVKANAGLTGTVDWERDRLRVVMAVDGVCRPMVAFACASVLDGSRGDHLTVAKLQPAANTRLEADVRADRRLLDTFTEMAARAGCAGATGRVLAGCDPAAALLGCAEEEHAHIIVIQGPASRSLPPHMVPLLRASRCGLLLFKSNG